MIFLHLFLCMPFTIFIAKKNSTKTCFLGLFTKKKRQTI